MDAAEAFRKNAEACSKMADKSPDPWDRANWERLAESWARLAKNSAKTGAKTGDARWPAATAPAVPTPEAGARRKRGQKKSPSRRRAPRKAKTAQ
jgi:hypothetical protein